jgi:hypothetical protein
MSSLVQSNEEEYRLKANGRHNHVWIIVDNLKVYIRRTDMGVTVDLYPTEGNTDECLAGTYAFFSEAIYDEDEEPPVKK